MGKCDLGVRKYDRVVGKYDLAVGNGDPDVGKLALPWSSVLFPLSFGPMNACSGVNVAFTFLRQP